MQAAGVKPSNYTLSILVKLLGRARCLNQAFSVVESLSRRHGFKPNVQVYTCLMQACILNKKLDRALKLHDTMVKGIFNSKKKENDTKRQGLARLAEHELYKHISE